MNPSRHFHEILSGINAAVILFFRRIQDEVSVRLGRSAAEMDDFFARVNFAPGQLQLRLSYVPRAHGTQKM
jgi:hypothetical protein